MSVADFIFIPPTPGQYPRCSWCGEEHFSEKFNFGGMEITTCPNVPDDSQLYSVNWSAFRQKEPPAPNVRIVNLDD